MLLILLVTIFAASVRSCDDAFDSPAVYQVTAPVDHAECPTWDSRRNLLFYVDIFSGRIFSYNWDTKELNSIKLEGAIAPVITSKNPNLLIVGLGRSIVAVEWDGKGPIGKQKVLATVQEDQWQSRMNDGKADKEGRLWFGTMGDGPDPNGGTLFKIDRDHVSDPQPMITPVNISNGLAWNKNNDKFYYIDSPTYQVAEYQYDNEKGLISNRRTVIDLTKHNLTVQPDGMTIDKDDNLWVALFNGGSVLHVNSTSGEIIQRVPIPAGEVTSTMWGGPNLDILFVTTSRLGLDEEGLLKQPGAGSVFAVTNLKTSGLPVFHADIIDSI